MSVFIWKVRRGFVTAETQWQMKGRQAGLKPISTRTNRGEEKNSHDAMIAAKVI